MANALTIAVQGMQNDMQRLDNISLNVANSATPGYRRTLSTSASFSEVLQRTTLGGARVAVPVSLPVLGGVLDPTSGPIKMTGQPLDLALDGDGYFELTTPDGPAYTRAGNFHLDASGRLVNPQGYPVSGNSGDIVAASGRTPTISAEGAVSDGDDLIGQLRVVRFANRHGLTMQGHGLLVPTDAAAELLATSAVVQVGYLESGNVVPLDEMVGMLETSRHFESQQKLFQGYDEQLSSAIQKLGQF